jgi:ATP-dependent DNA helicase RecQ
LVLRALWRLGGPPLEWGTAIDLEAMPASLGGASSLLPVLARLQAQQFISWTRTGGGVRPDPQYVGSRVPPVDWAALARRRAGDFGRLDAVERYARTRHCRRAFVLRYFGEVDTRAPCGACDRCLGLAE